MLYILLFIFLILQLVMLMVYFEAPSRVVKVVNLTIVGLSLAVLILWSCDVFFFTENGCRNASRFHEDDGRCQPLGSANVHVWHYSKLE